MKKLFLLFLTLAASFGAETGAIRIIRDGSLPYYTEPSGVTITGAGLAQLNAGSIISTGAVTAASFEASGDVAGSLLALPDDDGSHFFSIEAAGTTTTDVNMVGPASPISGLVKATVSGTTNMTLSAAVAGTDYPAGDYPVIASHSAGTLSDSPTINYVGAGYGAGANGNQGRYAIIAARDMTIVGYTFSTTLSTLGSGETATVDLWINNSTSVGSTETTFDAASRTFTVTGLSQAVTAGQTIEGRITNPTYSINPIVYNIRFEIITR